MDNGQKLAQKLWQKVSVKVAETLV